MLVFSYAQGVCQSFALLGDLNDITSSTVMGQPPYFLFTWHSCKVQDGKKDVVGLGDCDQMLCLHIDWLLINCFGRG